MVSAKDRTRHFETEETYDPPASFKGTSEQKFTESRVVPEVYQLDADGNRIIVTETKTKTRLVRKPPFESMMDNGHLITRFESEKLALKRYKAGKRLQELHHDGFVDPCVTMNYDGDSHIKLTDSVGSGEERRQIMKQQFHAAFEALPDASKPVTQVILIDQCIPWDRDIHKIVGETQIKAAFRYGLDVLISHFEQVDRRENHGL